MSYNPKRPEKNREYVARFYAKNTDYNGWKQINKRLRKKGIADISFVDYKKYLENKYEGESYGMYLLRVAYEDRRKKNLPAMPG